MGRGGYTAFLVLSLVIWSWGGYFNVSTALSSGTPFPYALLSLSALGPIAMVPLSLAQLWKLLTAERKETILDPAFIFAARQSLIARGVAILMCALLFVAGVWGLSGHVAPSGLSDSPLMSVLFIAIGAYGVVLSLFSPRIRMRLSPDGLEYNLMRPAMVPWHDITDVKLHSLFVGSWIVLTLKNTAEFRSAKPLARWRGVTRLSISPLMFGIDPEVLKQAIDVRRNVFTFD